MEPLVALIALHAPQAETGRHALPLLVMLRIHFLQQCQAFSDPNMEDKLYPMTIYRAFAGLDHGLTTIPDKTTTLAFAICSRNISSLRRVACSSAARSLETPPSF